MFTNNFYDFMPSKTLTLFLNFLEFNLSIYSCFISDEEDDKLVEFTPKMKDI
jgi:hypothetical protein